MSTVTAVTPIAPGADLGLLRTALTTARRSLFEDFQWRYAAGPDDAEDVKALAEELGLDAAGIVTTSGNVAATRNFLAAMGDGDYLLALDADDQWAPGGLAQMKWALDTRPTVAAAHGRAVDTDPTGTVTIFDPPAWWNTVPGDVFTPGVLAERRAEIHRAAKAWYQTSSVLGFYPVHHSAGLFRREAVLAVGGWDENTGHLFEDTLLTAKLQAGHSWFLTHGTVVLLYRKHTPHSLTGRIPGLSVQDIARLNEIVEYYERGYIDEAPPAPWPTPVADRSYRPVLIDGEDLEHLIHRMGGGDGERPAMSLIDQFVKPMAVRDPAAKTEEEYAAIEAFVAGPVAGVDTPDLDDQTPDLDDGPSLDELLRNVPPTDKDTP